MKKMRSDLTLKGSDIFLIGSAIGYGLKIQSNEEDALIPIFLSFFFILCLLKPKQHIVPTLILSH